MNMNNILKYSLVLIFIVSACTPKDYSQYRFTITTKETDLSNSHNLESKKIIFLNKIFEEKYDHDGEGPGDTPAYAHVSDGEYNLMSDQGVGISFKVENGVVRNLKLTSPMPDQIKPNDNECTKSSFLYKFSMLKNDTQNKDNYKYYDINNNGSGYSESVALFKFNDDNKIRVMSFWGEGIDDHLFNEKSILKKDIVQNSRGSDTFLTPLLSNDSQDQKHLEINNCIVTYYKNADFFNNHTLSETYK